MTGCSSGAGAGGFITRDPRGREFLVADNHRKVRLRRRSRHSRNQFPISIIFPSRCARHGGRKNVIFDEREGHLSSASIVNIHRPGASGRLIIISTPSGRRTFCKGWSRDSPGWRHTFIPLGGRAVWSLGTNGAADNLTLSHLIFPCRALDCRLSKAGGRVQPSLS